MFKRNPALGIIALIAVVNALGYGIIIPILYSYTIRFGLSDVQNGLLFSLFSLCQFIATPVIGKLSDKLGRKPLLIISLAGTALSFLLMAVTKSAVLLFVARALDGITAGNIPVASAVISDTTEPKDRAKGFGLIGAAFGFGFVFGPAISALTVGINPSLPFFIAATISLIAVLLTAIALPETHKQRGKIPSAESFHFGRLITAIADPRVGLTLLISLLYSFSFAMFTFSFQPFATKSLQMTPVQISITFTGLGLIGLVAQGFLIPRLVKKFGDVRTLVASLFLVVLSYVGLANVQAISAYIVFTLFYGLVGAPVGPLLQALLSKEVDGSSQGSILGLNASYVSIGTIFGPIIGGILVASGLNIPFWGAGLICFICFLLGLMHQRRLATQKVRI